MRRDGRRCGSRFPLADGSGASTASSIPVTSPEASGPRTPTNCVSQRRAGRPVGVSTEVGVFGPITYVMLANSRNPADFTDFSAIQDLAKRDTSIPASAWPSGDLLVPPAKWRGTSKGGNS